MTTINEYYGSFPDDVRRHVIDEYVGLDEILKDIKLVKTSSSKLVGVKFQHDCVCIAAIESHSVAFLHVKEQSLAICMAAAKADGKLVLHMKDEFKTREVYELAVSNMGGACMLAHVPKHLQTSKICLAAVKNDARVIKYVEEKYQNKTICKIACKALGRQALQYIKNDKRKNEMMIHFGW